MQLWLFQVIHEPEVVITMALSGGRSSNVVAEKIPQGPAAEMNGLGAMSEMEKF